MSPAPAPSSAFDDLVLPRLRARGLFGMEWFPWQKLSLPGATVDRVRRWLGEAFPGPLAALHHGSRDDVHFTSPQLEGAVRPFEGRLQVSTDHFDGGFLHAVALRAAHDGQACLVAEGDVFYGRTPFVALTEYRPGEAPRTEWFDPLRGLHPDLPRVQAWLETYLGETTHFTDWVLDPHAEPYAESLAWFQLMKRGEVLPSLRWVDREREPRPAPVPNVEVVPSLEEPVPLVEAAASAASSVVSLAVLSLVSLSICVLGSSLAAPRSVLDALVVCGACSVLVGWSALVPLKWPSGQLIAWRWRVAWFGSLPTLVPLALYASGGLS